MKKNVSKSLEQFFSKQCSFFTLQYQRIYQEIYIGLAFLFFRFTIMVSFVTTPVCQYVRLSVVCLQLSQRPVICFSDFALWVYPTGPWTPGLLEGITSYLPCLWYVQLLNISRDNTLVFLTLDPWSTYQGSQQLPRSVGLFVFSFLVSLSLRYRIGYSLLIFVEIMD